MKSLLKVISALFLFVLLGTPAFAQWQVAAHAVPIGRGPGVIGFSAATVGSAGRLLVDQGGSADPIFVPASGDCGITSLGVVTCTKLNGVAYSASPSTNTVPVVTGSNTITYEAVPNAALANSATTVNGVTCTLGSTCSVTSATTSLTIGTTTISGGTDGRIEFNNAGVLGEKATSGSGSVILDTSPTLTTPNLGTPTALVLTNATGTPTSIGLANGTGLPLSTGVTGQLPLANGGTNANLTASNGGIFYSTASAGAILAGTATAGQIIRSGSSTTPAWSTSTYPATSSAGTVLSSLTANTVTASANPVIGAVGTTGTLGLSGTTSGTATITPQATAGTPTLTLPNASGTFAVSATSPVVLSATTGAITCPTCATSSGGGAVTGTAPVAVSAAGVVSITGAAGQVLAGSSPAFTATPTLGVAGSTVGTLAFANATSGSITVSPPAGALGSVTLSLPATTDTLVGKATTDTLTNKTVDGLSNTITNVSLATGVTGNLPVTNLNSGSSASSLTFWRGDGSWATPAGAGTVTNSGNLANLAIVMGDGGTTGVKTVTGITTDGTSKVTLGVAGSSVGSVDFKNATSGTVTLSPVTGALGTVTLSLPATTDTLVGKATTDTLTNKSISGSTNTITNVSLTSGVTGTLPIANGGTGGTAGAVTVVSYQVFTASGTYTPNANMFYATIECVGSGGGGGGTVISSASAVASGGGGGGGSYSRVAVSKATVGASQTVTIGTAGTGGNAGNNAGNAGGDTSVGTLCVGKGGSGGGAASSGSGGSSNSRGTGGAGGVVGTGDVTIVGGDGVNGWSATTNATVVVIPQGGESVFGSGAKSAVNGTGTTATVPGTGGAGGNDINNAAARAGGDGKAGIVIITEYRSS